MDILNVSRSEFPKSTAVVEGMIVLKPECDNYELNYKENIVYSRGEKELHLQIIKPINPPTKTPLIIYVPGSAFHKQNVIERVAQLALLAKKGICVALLEYTESDILPFPALIKDVKQGIKYMKENWESYNVNPKSIFLMGDSSGAYAAMMAGFTNGIKTFENDDAKWYEVKGVIDFYGPTDITTMNNEPSTQNHSEPDSPEGYLIGRKEVLDNLELASSTIIKNYIYENKNHPPLIMFHGSNDELVPFSQSCELYTVLKAFNKDVKLYQIDGAHHGDREFWSESILKIIENFIK